MPKKDTEGIIPSDIEAEENFLASIILDPDVLDKIDMPPDAFLDIFNSKIYKAILELKANRETIDEYSVAKKAAQYGCPASLIPGIIARVPSSLHVEYYASKVKEAYTKRRFFLLGEKIKDTALDNTLVMEQLINKIMSITDEIKTLAADTPRVISVKCQMVKRTTPPFYIFNVSGQGKTAQLSFRSGEVLNKKSWTRKVMDALQFIPLLPKNFFDYISQEISCAPVSEAPEETKEELYLLKLVRDFIRSGFEAEDSIDLESRGRPGYIDKQKMRWFKGDSLCDALKTKTKLDKGEIWNILSDNGAQRKNIRFKDRPVWLWGLPLSFFTEKAPEDEQEEISIDNLFGEL